ncbi:SWIM zinc finger family protein [candidate division WS5 bacterium]|uniref:SWIM zinc finger family protein n=1 Tax=candidate division WS5 bacterium TaxID=2093353 RepID=A0A419DB14_9BACT|nr:MAG: SWIM zinc finger family protein [candidate division WS5 bacterium]
MPPLYGLDKIKFATDPPTFERAVGLYGAGKVTQFKEELNGFFATVLGTKPYQVYVDRKHYDQGDCECYLGQNNTLCKHMVAVAIYAVMDGKKLSQEDEELVSGPKCSGRLGELSKVELVETKKAITSAMRYIKPYNGPSRLWFAYQGSLAEGCARLSKLVSDLPVGEQTAKLLVDLLLRLDKKLGTGGVDDSDGTVGGFVQEMVLMLAEYAKLKPKCVKAFEKFCSQSTCFGWEEPLVEMYDERNN